MSGINTHKSLISIGSNMGDRLHFVESAILEMKRIPVTIVAKSKILETKPIGIIAQPDFLNCIVSIETSLSPMELLDTLQQIEINLGRVRRFEKGPREIDLDILTYDSIALNNERLTLPHHSIKTRPFIQELMQDLHLVNLV